MPAARKPGLYAKGGGGGALGSSSPHGSGGSYSHVIERTGCELWVCADGGCVSHEAGFEDYREGVLAAIEAEAVAEERRAEARRVGRQQGLEAKRAARKPRSAGE